MNNKHRNNKIFTDELKRTIPIYILGMIFHAIVIYILYKIPSIVGNILDLFIIGNINKETIMKEVYSLIFYSTIMIIPRIMYRTLFFKVARKSDTYLRSKVIEHLQSVKPEYFDKEEKGAFLAYLSKELLNIRKFLGNGFFYISKLIVAPILALVVIGKQFNIWLALSITPIFPIAIYILYRLNKRQNEAIEQERQTYLELSNTIEQNTSGFSLIKLYNEQENQRKKFKVVNDKATITTYNIGDVINKIEITVNTLYALCYCIGFSLGLVLIKNGLLTIGALTAYISCISIAISEMINSIQPLMQGIAYFKQARKRYNYFFNLDTYKKDGKKLKEIKKLEIKNLYYTYTNNENYVIKKLNMTINKGQKIGIVGKVGSGKTTLMNILAGFYEIENGQIYINGIDINEYSKDEIFNNIGYAMQKSIITDDTIKNNIDIKAENDETNIERVIKKANIYEDIQDMQEGINTKIGENGVKVSGGQKQRIQIARNLVNIRKINIFDDTLSALDSETEKRVLDEIEKEVGENILIIISNKISMMEKMDKVYLLVDGEIIASGTHTELLQQNKLYKELDSYERAGDLV